MVRAGANMTGPIALLHLSFVSLLLCDISQA